MSDSHPQLDENLVRLFEDANAPLSGEVFAEQFERRVARARRIRLTLQVAGMSLLAVIAALIAPYAIQGSLALGGRLAPSLSSLGLAMLSPAGWAGSLLLGGWILRRCHVFDR